MRKITRRSFLAAAVLLHPLQLPPPHLPLLLLRQPLMARPIPSVSASWCSMPLWTLLPRASRMS